MESQRSRAARTRARTLKTTQPGLQITMVQEAQNLQEPDPDPVQRQAWICRDYERIEELDRYEEDGLDNEDQPEVSLSEQLRGRRAAERALHQRDAVEGRLTGRTRARLPGALLAGTIFRTTQELAA